MPNRIIKESICTSQTVAELSDFEFRLWVSLITYVDDSGKGDARPQIIKGTCFPLREKVTPRKLEKALNVLAAKGLIRYELGVDRPVLKIEKWEIMFPEAGRKTPEYKSWRKAVFERDNYTCQICGQRGGKLNAHHVSRYAKSPGLRTDINNGITLCEQCHKELHQKEGK